MGWDDHINKWADCECGRTDWIEKSAILHTGPVIEIPTTSQLHNYFVKSLSGICMLYRYSHGTRGYWLCHSSVCRTRSFQSLHLRGLPNPVTPFNCVSLVSTVVSAWHMRVCLSRSRQWWTWGSEAISGFYCIPNNRMFNSSRHHPQV
jgi:hypothetical protein